MARVWHGNAGLLGEVHIRPFPIPISNASPGQAGRPVVEKDKTELWCEQCKEDETRDNYSGGRKCRPTAWSGYCWFG